MNMQDKKNAQLMNTNSSNISSNAVYQQTLADALQTSEAAKPNQAASSSMSDAENRIKQMALKDIQQIENMINSGVVSPEQGQNLMNYVVNKAYNEVKQQKGLSTQQPVQNSVPAAGYLNNLDNPEFFQQDGRNQVLEYLKNSYPTVGKDEMSQIINMITGVENSAIQRYLRKQEHDKALMNANEAAKQRLIANAQKSNAGNGTGVIFTREQIGKMSGAEFAKYEKAIMEQLRKGLIK